MFIKSSALYLQDWYVGNLIDGIHSHFLLDTVFSGIRAVNRLTIKSTTVLLVVIS